MQLTYKMKIAALANNEKAQKLINCICAILKKQYECNNITLEQLKKIQNLAENTEQLKNVLTFL